MIFSRLLLAVDILGMQKKAILTIYGLFSILGLLSAVFGVLTLLLPLTRGEADVVVSFTQPIDSTQKPLSEGDKKAVLIALGEIIDQPAFSEAIARSGFSAVANVLDGAQGRVAGDWTEKIKVQPHTQSSSLQILAEGGKPVENQKLAGAVAQVLALRAPDFIGGGIITARAESPTVNYLLPGWALADLIVGGLFFFGAGLYGLFTNSPFVSIYRNKNLIPLKVENVSTNNHDARYWLQKFLDENRS